MAFSKTGFLALAMASLALAGCQSERMSSINQPAPLTPAPSGTVTGAQLPPPAAPGTTTRETAAPAAPILPSSLQRLVSRLPPLRR